jgi:hypothetical protein
LSLPPPEALVVVAKPANRLQLPTPVPAGTPDSGSGNPARCGKGGGSSITAFVEPAGRQRYLEALDQGPGERKSFNLWYPDIEYRGRVQHRCGYVFTLHF